ncbi:putative protein phosphatase 2C 33 [Abeliophyllum distichum]|uniref:PPM-type phosphatase domain-containing protein n=1 Tax=Abeliophyllum distichum TaxID=126358 RepID=A0ABD1TFK4_9LAMI
MCVGCDPLSQQVKICGFGSAKVLIQITLLSYAGCTLPDVSMVLNMQKFNFDAEAEKIRKCKGRVFALRDEPKVATVWLPNNDSPDLAMARAFGDFCLKEFGLISVPEISYRHITDEDKFIVLATDGV